MVSLSKSFDGWILRELSVSYPDSSSVRTYQMDKLRLFSFQASALPQDHHTGTHNVLTFPKEGEHAQAGEL